MMKKYYVGIIVFILFVVFSIIILVYNKTSKENYSKQTIRYLQYFDSSKGIILLIDKEGISHGDFQWQSTIYQNKSIGSISGEFVISLEPYKSIIASRLKKIQNTDFDSVSKTTCSEIKYEELNSFSNVDEGDILCVSMDKNRDGGDGYLKLKIISHTDSKEGKYADSMTFMYKVL